MSSFFPGSSSVSSTSTKDKAPAAVDVPPRPVTPTMNNFNSFINPLNTPLGSPSKKTIPPGAHDLPGVFESAMNLHAGAIDAPVRLTHPQSVVAPLSPGKQSSSSSLVKTQVQPLGQQPREDLSPVVDESALKKGRASPGTPRRRQAQDKEQQQQQPRLGHDQERQERHSHAALSRQQAYETKERPIVAKRFNTARGLTAEEREILQRPNVRRMVNVTQLCRCLNILDWL